MGSTYKDEAPVHEVRLDSYWIMQTEVTNAQYGKCVAAGVCNAPLNSHWQDIAMADYPVTDIDWNQATRYANWVGGQLPTEAEWEKAARGEDARTYPWGEETTDEQHLNFQNMVGAPMPVGSYPAGASPYGLLDMAGNVEEWVNDWHQPTYYAVSPSFNPLGPDTGTFRVVRGGSYNSSRGDVRTTVRGKALPDAEYPNTGFRVVVAEFK